MFTTVHRTSVVKIVFCALLLLNALPMVVRSQEDIKTSTSQEVPIVPVDSSNSTGTNTQVPSSLSNLYPVEGVPGGDIAVGDFVVGPGKIDATIKPGESKIVEIFITNRTGERRIFNITTEDAGASSDPKKSIILLGDDKGQYSMKDFISVPYKSFEIGQNERARIPVTITIPPNADPGGLYGSVLVDTIAVDAKPGDTAGAVPQSAIIARIGTLFFVTIPGAIEKKGNLSDFGTISKQLFFQGSPIGFGILFENKGSIHLSPYGEMRIANMFGEEVGYVELEPWFVMPKSTRLREVSWNRDFLFGRYTAKVFVNRSYDDVVDEMSFSFWVLPWKIMLAGFAGLFIVLFILRTFFKSFEFKRKR